jgi:prepilin-type N-terminal cleavage/methylation domain-containing protein
MKSKPMFRRQQQLQKSSRRLGRNPYARFPHSLGFTLIELLIASLLVSVVILVAWTGLLSIMNMTQAAEARTARQTELNQALDFMTNEIRMARSINASESLSADGTNVTLENVITSAGVDPAALGNYGTIGLYLERPTLKDIPAVCPPGGPNAGDPPPAPADFDPVVYDIRPSPGGWLQPRMVARYGRTPSSDGSVNPCNNPVSSDPMVDALSTTMKTTPTCSGVLSGEGGFYSCVNAKEVNLFFQSDISNVEAKMVTSTVTSRVLDIEPQTAPSAGCPGEENLRSLSNTKKAELTIFNQKSVPVKVYWIDYSGARVFYSDLAPYQKLKVKTYLDNPWVVTDSSQVCLGIYTAQGKKSAANVNED